MAVDRTHPIIRAVRPGANDDEGHWARDEAEQCETLLAAARALGPEVDDVQVAGALRAAAVAIHGAFTRHQSVDTLRWYESATRELEAIARQRFGPHQTLVSLGYRPRP